MTTMRSLLLLAVAALSSVPARAEADPFGQFRARATLGSLKPFARDLGGLLGSASAHSGRTLGMPGFWVGAVGAVQTRPDRDNQILRGAGVDAFGLPMIEAQVGLPFKFDVIAHGMRLEGATIYGGGLRYGVYRTDLVDTFLPNVSVSAIGDKVVHEHFSAQHGGFNAAATWNLPIVKPFLVAGYDVTKLEVGAASAAGLAGASATASGSRFTGGLELTPFPFVSLRGAYTVRHGVSGFDAGLGVKF